jgi:UDP-glucose 4-epimerase
MKILVTGGAGFIGSNIVKLLCDLNHEVVVFDNLSEGYKEAVDTRASLIVADLKDKKDIKKALKGVEVVIHMAALIEVGESVKHPELFFQNNVVNGMNLLEEIRLANIKKLIFSSTAAVYADNVEIPIKEEAEKLPSNPYGATKLMLEKMIFTYYKCYGINSTVLRYFNVYGPWQRKHQETLVVPNFMEAVIKNKKVPLYWQGKCIRDFIYVEDIARAHIAPLKQNGFHIYNVGTSDGTSIINLLEMVAKVAGKKYEIEDLGKREGDQLKTIARVSKIKDELGWKAQVSLEEGLKKTYKFYYKNNS